MTTIGDLDQRVRIRRNAKTTDGAGGYTRAWSTVATVWAQVRPLSGREAVEAGRLEASGTYLITIRNRSDLLDDDVIEWKGREMNIRFVRRVSTRELFLSIEAGVGVPT